MRLFHDTMRPTESLRVLDVGAEVAATEGASPGFIDEYPWKARLSALNLLAQHVQLIRDRYPDVDTRVGDARCLPWPDKHFDIVFSNAVIEHVGSFADQQKMAAEIIRVGKRWFVTTPNRWYPFEFHVRLPLVTWLPRHGYQWVGGFLSYNHVCGRYQFKVRHWERYTGTRLLTAGELRRCFPESRVIKHRVTFMPETLVVIGGTELPSPLGRASNGREGQLDVR
jgi:hypothetical protein